MTRRLTLSGSLILALALLAACSGKGGAAYQRGVTALNAGDMRTARVELLNALETDPANRTARLMLARVDLVLGDGVAAESDVNRARQAGAPASESAHLLAHAKLLQGDAQAALAETAVAAPEHEAYASRIAGRAYLALGDNDNARVAFNRALALSPNDSDVWTDVARFRSSNGDLGGALEAADRAVAARPSNVEALVLHGTLTRSQYGLAAAIPWFDQAISVDRSNVEALLERASTLGDLGRMSEMLADARAVHRLTGGHRTAYYLEAVLAARGRNFQLAKGLWARTGGAFDNIPAGRLLLSAIDFETGNEEQAARRLTALVGEQPRNRRARRLLAAAQWRMGDSNAVANTLRPIADMPDADSYSLSLMGRAMVRLGDNQAGALYLARASRPQPGSLASLESLSEGEFAAVRAAALENPGNGPAQVRLVAALLARRDVGEALSRARNLQDANPGVPEVHILLGDALGISGDYAEAAQAYRHAANLAFTENVALRLIDALVRSGQIEAADNVLGLFVQQNPRSVPGLILLGGRAMQQQDWAFAITIYESLRRRIGDNDATILNNLAWAYAESGEVRRALPLARRAWALARDNPATADTLGWLLFKNGARAEGLALLQRAARGAPSDADVRRRLAQAQAG
ncbi:MAG TPA: tetratricopeptide repeat protein [Allosphingosinicella sp.]|nr:tetratricopeptide repeat protein [Allosphingosinicella sp.]